MGTTAGGQQSFGSGTANFTIRWTPDDEIDDATHASPCGWKTWIGGAEVTKKNEPAMVMDGVPYHEDPWTLDEEREVDHGRDHGKRLDPFDDDEPIESSCDLENPTSCESCT